MTIFVLEGPDGAGKSYLAQQIQQELPDTLILRQGPPTPGEDLLEKYLRPIENIFVNGTRQTSHVVMDRWHVGELVYGPLLRGKSMLTRAQMNYIDMVLGTFDARFYFMSASLDTLLKRYDKRGDELISRDQIEHIKDEYTDLLVPLYHWEVVSFMRLPFVMPPVRHVQAPNAGRYIGPPGPKVLLLGDVRGNEKFTFPFVPYQATSGHWLMTAMADAHVDHMLVGVMNACEMTPDELSTQWDALGQPPVITLGRNAQRAWKTVGDWNPNKDHYLHHPQYARRFNHRSTFEYGQTIKDVMK